MAHAPCVCTRDNGHMELHCNKTSYSRMLLKARERERELISPPALLLMAPFTGLSWTFGFLAVVTVYLFMLGPIRLYLVASCNEPDQAFRQVVAVYCRQSVVLFSRSILPIIPTQVQPPITSREAQRFEICALHCNSLYPSSRAWTILDIGQNWEVSPPIQCQRQRVSVTLAKRQSPIIQTFSNTQA
eukprot:2590439-Amphidinium_carterae.1